MSTKVRIQVGRVWLEVDSTSVKDAIRDLSDYADVFSHTSCGACQSQEVRPTHRQAQGYDFYEMTCLACGARLSFGQLRDGDGLFPKRKDKEGNWLSGNGWVKYQQAAESSDDMGF